MEILFERWHHEYRGQGLYFPKIEWRCRVVEQFRGLQSDHKTFHLSATTLENNQQLYNTTNKL